jgi:CheY-like chemotaxis protein
VPDPGQRRARAGGGALTIDTSNDDVDEGYAEMQLGLTPGRYVRLRVSDTGGGMPADVRQRAFEPFYTTKPKGEGSGLGLATVHGIVHQAGGWLQLYSEEGLGTAVTILLPESHEQVPGPAPVVHHREDVHREETVLVIEDEEALREVARRILIRHGYQVLVAASGPQALELVAGYDEPLHLVLTDVVMPQMLGKEVATRLREVRPDLRILYMSGYAQPVLASQGSLEPDVVLLEKPFSEASMLRKIREVLDS